VVGTVGRMVERMARPQSREHEWQQGDALFMPVKLSDDGFRPHQIMVLFDLSVSIETAVYGGGFLL
jgi:hypothetical protein